MTAKLSHAQLAGLLRLARYPVIYDHEQIALATAQVLVRKGLAEWAEKPHWVTHYGVKSSARYTRQWSLRIAQGGRDFLNLTQAGRDLLAKNNEA